MIEYLPGTENVIRFPVERRVRPTMELLREIRLDARTVLANAETMGYEAPEPDVRDRTDRSTAEHILLNTSTGERPSKAFLDELLDPVVTRAVELTREAGDAVAQARAAQKAVAAARACKQETTWLNERASLAMFHACGRALEAHIEAEKAEGVARAVGFARRGETWRSRDEDMELDLLMLAYRGRG
jgi:hypothetical protein